MYKKLTTDGEVIEIIRIAEMPFMMNVNNAARVPNSSKIMDIHHSKLTTFMYCF